MTTATVGDGVEEAATTTVDEGVEVAMALDDVNGADVAVVEASTTDETDDAIDSMREDEAAAALEERATSIVVEEDATLDEEATSTTAALEGEMASVLEKSTALVAERMEVVSVGASSKDIVVMDVDRTLTEFIDSAREECCNGLSRCEK